MLASIPLSVASLLEALLFAWRCSRVPVACPVSIAPLSASPFQPRASLTESRVFACSLHRAVGKKADENASVTLQQLVGWVYDDYGHLVDDENDDVGACRATRAALCAAQFAP